MKVIHKNKQIKDNEKGAAMVIVLMIASVMLVACIGVLLQVSMHSANVSDINAEQQAYDAAESGLQTALNVLRGNTQPSPLIDDTKPADHSSNRITFTKAIETDTSNEPTDTTGIPRLSRWINYDYTPGGATNAERVTIGSETYTPLTGNAYSLEILDPDNPQKIISLELSCDIDGGGSSKTFGTVLSSATITYNSSTHSNVDVSTREANIDLGSFTITTTGAGAAVPNDVRFEIKVKMTAPYNVTKIVRGTITQGFIGSNSIFNVQIDFDSPIHNLMGSIITIPDPITPNAPDTNGGKTDINIKITLSEPIRLIVRSTGYGPRGAKKTLEAFVKKDFFNLGLIPATLTMIGDSKKFLLKSAGNNEVTFSGNDASRNIKIPPVATTSSTNLSKAIGSLTCSSHNCPLNSIGKPENIVEELPDWLSSTEKLDATLNTIKSYAKATGRYFPKDEPPTNFGNNADGTGITFVDDDLKLTGAGGGIIVTTGSLSLKDSIDFNGIIIVTGKEGVEKEGSGTITIHGNVVIAPYLQTDLDAGFLSPRFDTSGGVVSQIMLTADVTLYNLTAGVVTVAGIVEK